jgi:ATP-binding cassette subfamily F protein uup
MTSLLGIHSLSKAFGTQELFSDLSFTISDGERIGLIGPNGSGKTTLLRIMAKLESPDDGHLTQKQGLRVAYACQEPHFPSKPIEELVMEACPEKEIHERKTQARIWLGKAEFADFTQDASTLSGGWKKRLDIVRAVISNPDLLLLDEPTNHLDLEGILWLENFLKRSTIPYVLVSHDRTFLEQTTNKIIEINRCYPAGLFSSDGSFSKFLDHKEAFLEAQLKNEDSLASQVREETEWLRRSPKARTTKSSARVQKAHQMMEELALLKRRNTFKKAAITFNASERETRKLITAKNLSIDFGRSPLFQGVDVSLTPGDCLGIVGKNGTGKTTLLKMLAGEIKPSMGTIKYAEDIRIVYFDQHREKVGGDKTLFEALGDGNDIVYYQGKPIHVNGWAQRFLFSPDRMTLPVKYLSGGERARILIAKLMLKPADVLFLDEPTNDLDIETLEVMEQSLKEFPGAVVLISHDRTLMDHVCTGIIALGDSQGRHFASYRQWDQTQNSKKDDKSRPSEVKKDKPVRKLSYNEKKELDSMEAKIMAAEVKIDEIQARIDKDSSNAKIFDEMTKAHQELEMLYERWQTLTEIANQ